eukprot:COSAG06_NODE_2531_length_6712_cov_3.173446_6_plen_140_part_00
MVGCLAVHWPRCTAARAHTASTPSGTGAHRHASHLLMCIQAKSTQSLCLSVCLHTSLPVVVRLGMRRSLRLQTSIRPTTVLHWPAFRPWMVREKRPSFSTVPYICPEPVLGDRWSSNGKIESNADSGAIYWIDLAWPGD